MTGRSHSDYSETYHRTSSSYTGAPVERLQAAAQRAERISKSRSTTSEARARQTHSDREQVDQQFIKRTITSPPADARIGHFILVDNSTSNHMIAQHFMRSSDYLAATILALDPTSVVCIRYFSDHRDGEIMFQDVDYFSPDLAGSRVLRSTTSTIKRANGHDWPEAIECALWDMCDLDFGAMTEKRLYLVSDSYPHGMPGHVGQDDGCPNDRNWKDAVERVNVTFNSFEIVGCSGEDSVAAIQGQMLHESRISWDLIGLSNVRNEDHRKKLSLNATLFLIARHSGPQGVLMFLGHLYEKWLDDPVYGARTDQKARHQIYEFCKYLEVADDERTRMANRIFSD